MDVDLDLFRAGLMKRVESNLRVAKINEDPILKERAYARAEAYSAVLLEVIDLYDGKNE